MPLVLRAISCAVLYPMLSTLVIRAYLYGWSDMSVIRMGLYLILPVLLFVSLDILCKLINMYRIGLEIIKKREEEMKEKKEN